MAYRYWVALLACLTLGAPAQAQDDAQAPPAAPATSAAAETGPPAHIATSAFAGRNDFVDASLSPDGGRFAFSITIDGTRMLSFYDAATMEALRSIPLTKDLDLNWFRWAGNDRIVYSLGGKLTIGAREVYISRAYAYDFAKNEKHYLGFAKQALIGDDVIHVDPAGGFVLLDVAQDMYSWPDVWRFPLDGSGAQAAVKVQPARKDVGDWLADDAGVVRMGYGRLSSGRLYVTYRSGPDDSWNRVARAKRDSDEEEMWDGIGLFAGSDTGYALIPDAEGREALYEFNYAAGEVGKTVHAVPGQSIGSVLGSRGRVQGVGYTDDEYRSHWFDPAMAEHQRMLEQVLPDTSVRILSVSDDETRMIIYTGTAADPGALYIYTPAERQLALFDNVRPGMDPADLVRPEAVDIATRDGQNIRAYLTLPRGRAAKGLPLIILPHGGPFGVRDTLRYDDEVQLLANRGYAVLQPNYRGSGGYGRSFEKLGEGQVGRAMQDDLDDARAWAVDKGVVDGDRVCMVGGSYGGYAALWAVLRNPELYRCAASWAGVTDWDDLLRYDRNYLGRRGYRAQKGRLRGEDKLDLDEVSPVEMAETLKRPVLLAHGRTDRRVPFAQYETFVRATRDAPVPVETLELDEGHSFTDAVTEQAWYDALEAFLAEHNPADTPVGSEALR